MNYGAVDALRFADCYALLWLGISAFYLYLLQLLQLWAEQYVVQLSGILSLLQTENPYLIKMLPRYQQFAMLIIQSNLGQY